MTEDSKESPRRGSSERQRGRRGRSVFVLPGEYTLRIGFGGESSETKIKVETDPRVEYEEGEIEAKYTDLKEIEAINASLAKATDRINEALEIVGDYDKKLKEKKEDSFKEIKEQSKEVKNGLNELMDEIVGKESDKQGIVRSPDPSVTSYVWSAMYYVATVSGKPGATEERLMTFARDKASEIIQKVNEFFEKDWNDYKVNIQAVELSPFKDYEKIDLK